MTFITSICLGIFLILVITEQMCEKLFFLGLNEAWQVSYLSYTETNDGVKGQPGNLCPQI